MANRPGIASFCQECKTKFRGGGSVCPECLKKCPHCKEPYSQKRGEFYFHDRMTPTEDGMLIAEVCGGMDDETGLDFDASTGKVS